MGHSALVIVVLTLILSDFWQVWFVSSGLPALFSVIPSFSEIYRDIRNIYCQSEFPVSICAFLFSSLPWPLVDIAQLASIYPLSLHNVLLSLLFLIWGPAHHTRVSSLAAWCGLQSAYSSGMLQDFLISWLPVSKIVNFSSFAYFTCGKHSICQLVCLYSFYSRESIARSHYHHRRFRLC